MADSGDTIAAAEVALWAAVKGLANALWIVQNEPGTFTGESTRAMHLGEGLDAAFTTLEASFKALPDLSPVADKVAYDARLAALDAERAALLPRLQEMLQRKEARLAEVECRIESITADRA
jgi:hypothetical protein